MLWRIFCQELINYDQIIFFLSGWHLDPWSSLILHNPNRKHNEEKGITEKKKDAQFHLLFLNKQHGAFG